MKRLKFTINPSSKLFSKVVKSSDFFLNEDLWFQIGTDDMPRHDYMRLSQENQNSPFKWRKGKVGVIRPDSIAISYQNKMASFPTQGSQYYTDQLWLREGMPLIDSEYQLMYGGYDHSEQYPSIENKSKQCTCGVDKCGGGIHSNWCDKK